MEHSRNQVLLTAPQERERIMVRFTIVELRHVGANLPTLQRCIHSKDQGEMSLVFRMQMLQQCKCYIVTYITDSLEITFQSV